MRKKKVHSEGDWFAVPLENGQFATGLLARLSPSGIALGYFFGPSRDRPGEMAGLELLTPEDAVLVGRFGDLSLQDKTWPVTGRVDPWVPRSWPMPVLIRHQLLTGLVLKVFYDDSDPQVWLRTEPVTQGEELDGPEDGMMGAGFVEARLSRLLDAST